MYLTEAGRAIQEQVRWVWTTMEAEVFAGFDEKERAQLRGFLLRLRANLLCAGKDSADGKLIDQGKKIG